MDLVDEEDRALRRVGEEGHDVHLLVERRAARDAQLDAELVVQHGRERGLAQAGRAVEEDVRQRLAPLPRGGQADLEPLGDGPLPDHFREPLRAKLLVDGIGWSRLGGCVEEPVRRLVGAPWIVGFRIGVSSSVSWHARVRRHLAPVSPRGRRRAQRLLSTLQIDRFYHIGD